MVAQERCRCGVLITGSSAVKSFQQHGSLCRQCRGEPIGYDRERHKDDMCTYCKRKFGEH